MVARNESGPRYVRHHHAQAVNLRKAYGGTDRLPPTEMERAMKALVATVYGPPPSILEVTDVPAMGVRGSGTRVPKARCRC